MAVEPESSAEREPEAGPRYYFFSGKGGVGKTTLAAAKAVSLARSGLRVMITSTDPAHSLSDVFDRQIGDEGVMIEDRLFALEVDSSARWAAATSGLGTENTSRLRGGRFQRAMGDAVRMLGDAPGVDEFMSLELLIETMSADKFDAVVFDTAPTGHTLRLMLLPRMLDGWVGKLLAVRGTMAKIGRVFRKLLPKDDRRDSSDLDGDLQTVRARVADVRALITDPERTCFALVTIPEALSVFETQRTLQQLGEHGIQVSKVFANQVQPASEDCAHCKLRRQIHQRELERLKALLGSVELSQVESKSIVIRGPQALAELGQEIWAAKGD